jgi:pseudouridine kinase
MSLIDSLTADRLSKRAGIINRSNAVIVDANLSDDALSYVFANVDEQPIFVDPVSTIKARKLLPYLSHIHTIKPNIAEAEVLAGIKYRSLDDLPKLADILHKRGIQRLLISLGADGAFASTPEEHTLIPAVKVRVNNVTGAGDALMAGLVHSHINNLSWHEGIEFALAASRVALSANNTINNKMSEHAVYTVLQETQPC